MERHNKQQHYFLFLPSNRVIQCEGQIITQISAATIFLRLLSPLSQIPVLLARTEKRSVKKKKIRSAPSSVRILTEVLQVHSSPQTSFRISSQPCPRPTKTLQEATSTLTVVRGAKAAKCGAGAAVPTTSLDITEQRRGHDASQQVGLCECVCGM